MPELNVRTQNYKMLVSLILIVLLFPICAVLLWKLHISLENYSERNSYHTPTM
ncbi:unnamed protein product [Tenebrio molitor]|nr:unnamed protein product [Tenebrio molitor]